MFARVVRDEQQAFQRGIELTERDRVDRSIEREHVFGASKRVELDHRVALGPLHTVERSVVGKCEAANADVEVTTETLKRLAGGVKAFDPVARTYDHVASCGIDREPHRQSFAVFGENAAVEGIQFQQRATTGRGPKSSRRIEREV